MPQMLVKDLIEILQNLDPELPIHKHKGAGEFAPVDIDYAGYWLGYENLMANKTDPSYVARQKDPIWKRARRRFGEPFKAVVFW